MPQLPRDQGLLPMRPVEAPTPSPEAAGMVPGAVAGAGGNLLELGKRLLQQEAIQRTALAHARAEELRGHALSQVRTYSDHVAQTLTDDQGNAVDEHQITANVAKYAEGVHKQMTETLNKELGKFAPQGLERFETGFQSDIINHIGNVTMRDQNRLVNSKIAYTTDQAVTSIVDRAKGEPSDKLKREVDGLLMNPTMRMTMTDAQLSTKRQQAYDAIDMIPYQQRILRGDARDVIKEVQDGKVKANIAPDVFKYANTYMSESHARWSNEHQENEAIQKGNAVKEWDNFLAKSLQPNVTADALEHDLLGPGMRERMSWATGTYYDNAVTYVHTLRHRAQTEGRIVTQRPTLVEVETGISNGMIKSIDDLNKYESRLSDHDYKNFAGTLLHRSDARTHQAYSQGQREITLMTQTMPALFNFDQAMKDIQLNMVSEYNSRTRQLQDSNNHDDMQYLGAAREIIQRYMPRIQQRLLLAPQEMQKNLIFQTPQEAEKVLGKNTTQYLDWLVKYKMVQDAMAQGQLSKPTSGSEKPQGQYKPPSQMGAQ